MKTKGNCEASGKTRYLSFLEASRIAKRMNRSYQSERGYHLEVYECKHCKDFHIGSHLNSDITNPEVSFYIEKDLLELEEIFSRKIKHVSLKQLKKSSKKKGGSD